MKLFWIVTLACVGILSSMPGAAATRPNIIYLLADDLGYGDLGSYGQQLIRTPRLDALAAAGMRFTQHYAGAPSCAPARCVLMTGLHTGHARLRANTRLPLLPEDTTFPQLLQRAGYATGGVGKWGLGLEDSTGAPWQKGFDQFFGYLDQRHAHTYYPDHLWRNAQRVEIPENRDGARVIYSHDLFVDEALDFIRQHSDRPFFFYGALTIPHAEMAVPADSLAEYEGRWPEPRPFAGSATYQPQTQPRAVRAAMITRLDRDVGRILDLLDELGIAERTLVIFTSDNGPITAGGQDPEFFNSTGGLHGLKFTLYEGGIRVPFIARWPNRIAPGGVSDFVSDFADMFPTFTELAGVTPPDDLDGVSILATLLGQRDERAQRQYHYWEAAPQQAIRVGDWKAYRPAPHRPIELYHLGRDPGETRNLAEEHPEEIARLGRLMETVRIQSPDFPLPEIAP
jgi:arylsulfatase A